MLRKGRSVITVGLPGIGKLTEMNYMLMIFLRNIGQEGWPKVILLRMKKKLYEFYLKDDGQPEVTVNYMKDLNGDLLKYKEEMYYKCPTNQKPVFFL